MQEIWKDVTGYEGIYQVSNLGNVKSLYRKVFYTDGRNYIYKERILNWNIMKKVNRCYVHLYKNSERKSMLVHRLVAQAFIPNPDDLPEVNHKSGITTENDISNLEWVTHSDNMKHGILHGNNIYTETQIKQVKTYLAEGKGQAEIQRLTGVGRSTVYEIKKGRQWTHIDISKEITGSNGKTVTIKEVFSGDSD